MERPASEVYEIVLEEPGPHRGVARWWRRRRLSRDPGVRIISVRRRDGGDEVFRHIEPDEDDEDSLLGVLDEALATMEADEFADRWASS